MNNFRRAICESFPACNFDFALGLVKDIRNVEKQIKDLKGAVDMVCDYLKLPLCL